jgi:hypothetical protein
MAGTDDNHEEKQIDAQQHIPDSPVMEKPDAAHEETAHEAAERGHAATDQWVHPQP